MIAQPEAKHYTLDAEAPTNVLSTFSRRFASSTWSSAGNAAAALRRRTVTRQDCNCIDTLTVAEAACTQARRTRPELEHRTSDQGMVAVDIFIVLSQVAADTRIARGAIASETAARAARPSVSSRYVHACRKLRVHAHLLPEDCAHVDPAPSPASPPTTNQSDGPAPRNVLRRSPVLTATPARSSAA